MAAQVRRATGSDIIPWLPLALAAVLLLAGETIAWGVVGVRSQRDLFTYLIGPAFLVLPAVGALVLRRGRPRTLGWLLCLVGLAFAVYGASNAYGEGWLAGHDWPAGLPLLWLSNWVWVLSAPVLGSLVVLLFPNGRVPSRRWLPAAGLSLLMLAGLILRLMFGAGPLDHAPNTPNPFPAPAALGDAVLYLDAAFLLLPVTSILAATALVQRTRRAPSAERARLLGPAIGGVLIAASYVFCTFAAVAGNDNAVAVGPEIGAVAAIGIAIVVSIARHRLWDVRLILNRTLVFGLLTASVVAVYVVAVEALGTVAAGRAPSLVATALAALTVLPLQGRLQRAVNRLLYGDRDEPYRALTRLGDRLATSLASDQILPMIATTVAEALRLPYVEVLLDSDSCNPMVASAGEAGPGNRVELELVSRGEHVGYLRVETRGVGEGLSTSDRRLLDNIVRQVAVAAEAVALAGDLRSSRERVVVAAQEERRRMRRDLHDGLGPDLAAIALGLDRSRRQLLTDPSGASSTLAGLRSQVLAAIESVRRLSYELRPPALDQLGLVGALREQTERLNSGDVGTTRFLLNSPDIAAFLPAAIEVAAYRIASEAITNVARHSQAEECLVRIALNGALELEVRDDGRGLPQLYRAGVGLASMRERAEEVGGHLEVRRALPHGTSVLARFPLPPA